MFLTLEDYRKIESWLKLNSKKDTDFDFADFIDGNETITIVQGNKNKRMFISEFINSLGSFFSKDFANITAEFGLHNITLETAIHSIPVINRKEGLVITFEGTDSNWYIYQFVGNLHLWYFTDLWKDLLNWEGHIIESVLPDNEDLTATEPDEQGNTRIKFADKEYNPDSFSGLGHVILRKNLVEVNDSLTGKSRGIVNFLYQDMINKENTIYEIRYDFDLNGQTITVPDNCSLDFKGGSLSNTNLILGNNCSLRKAYIQIAHDGIIVLGNDCVIENCTFECVDYCLNGKGVLYAEGKKNIVISDCVFKEQQSPLESQKCSSIDLRNCDNFLIDKVVSYYSEGENIFLVSGKGIVSNTITYRGWSGIGTNTYGANVEHPSYKGDGRTSIILSNNIVINAIAAGITINTDNVICSNNTVVWQGEDEGHIVKMMGPGIRLGHSHMHANNCLVDGNIVRWGPYSTNTGASSSDRGISIDAGDNNVILNNYIEHTLTGIGSSVTLKSGTVIRNNHIISQITGISIWNDLSSTIEGNDILIEEAINNDCLGIKVRYGLHIIKGNKVRYEKEIQESSDLNLYTCLGIYIIMNDSDITVEGNDIIARTALLLEGNADTKCLYIKSNTLKSTKENRINTPCYKLICLDNHIIASSIFMSPISYIANNVITDLSSSVLRMESCEEYFILNNYLSTSNAYTLSAYITDTQKIKKVIINNNIGDSAVALVLSSFFKVVGDKLKLGYTPNFDTRYDTAPSFISKEGGVIDALGFPNTTRRGASSKRPLLLDTDYGFLFYDSTLGKLILWNGEKWINVDGTDL